MRFIPVVRSIILGCIFLASSVSFAQTASASMPAGPASSVSALAGRNTEECRKHPKICARGLGEITVGRPRVWRYDRVYPLVDGMLRDIEDMQITSLSGDKALNATALNNTSVTTLQQMTQVGVSYDQNIGMTNNWAVQDRQAKLDDLAAQRAEYQAALKTWTDNHDKLLSLRTQLFTQQNTEKTKLYDLNRQVTDPADSIAGKAELAKVQTQQEIIDQIQSDLNTNATEISGLGTAPTRPPALAAAGLTSADAAAALKQADSTPLTSTLNQLPDDVKTALKDQIAKAVVLPPSQVMQKQVALIYERMAQQLGVLGDDLSRDSKREIYLMGFDVGLYPSPQQKDRVARVEYTIGGQGDCTIYASKLLPDMSAYNMADYNFSSQGFVLSGIIKLFSGFSATADYQRLREQLHSGVSQAAYVSGFGAGTKNFGWYFGTAPFEKRVSPGSRSVYAFVVASKGCKPTLTYTAYWQKRDGGGVRGVDVVASNEPLSVFMPSSEESTAIGKKLTINSLSYVPTVVTAVTADSYGTVQIDLDEDIDPNLIVTVGGTTLRRVRDWRGRATVPSSSETLIPGSDPNSKLSLGRGLLEADTLVPDTWIAPNARTLLISVKASTAGNTFPAIRLLTGGAGYDVLSNTSDLRQIRIGNAIWSNSNQTSPRSAFLPLVYAIPEGNGSRKLLAALYTKNSADPFQLRLTGLDAGGVPFTLSAATQVSIKAQADDASDAFETFLSCSPLQGELICTLPKSQLKNLCLKQIPKPGGRAGETIPVEHCANSYPKVVSVQAIVPSLMAASTEFAPNDAVVPYVKSSPTITQVKDGNGAFQKWIFKVTFGGVCDGATKATSTLSDGSLLAGGAVPGDSSTYTFDITTKIFRLLADEMPIHWDCTDLKERAAEADIVGLARSLTPVVTGLAMNGTVLRGKFNGVTALRVNENTAVMDTHESESSIFIRNGFPDSGLLFLMVGDMPIPAVLNGDQIVIEQIGTGTGNLSKFAIAGTQPVTQSGASGGAPTSGAGATVAAGATNLAKPADTKALTPDEAAAATKDEAAKKAAADAAIKQTSVNVQVVNNK